jgi:hypothetical protein
LVVVFINSTSSRENEWCIFAKHSEVKTKACMRMLWKR